MCSFMVLKRGVLICNVSSRENLRKTMKSEAEHLTATLCPIIFYFIDLTVSHSMYERTMRVLLVVKLPSCTGLLQGSPPGGGLQSNRAVRWLDLQVPDICQHCGSRLKFSFWTLKPSGSVLEAALSVWFVKEALVSSTQTPRGSNSTRPHSC